jgi:hypothetical protein
MLSSKDPLLVRSYGRKRLPFGKTLNPASEIEGRHLFAELKHHEDLESLKRSSNNETSETELQNEPSSIFGTQLLDRDTLFTSSLNQEELQPYQDPSTDENGCKYSTDHLNDTGVTNSSIDELFPIPESLCRLSISKAKVSHASRSPTTSTIKPEVKHEILHQLSALGNDVSTTDPLSFFELFRTLQIKFPIRKIGEASFSDVFGVTKSSNQLQNKGESRESMSVMKILPFYLDVNHFKSEAANRVRKSQRISKLSTGTFQKNHTDDVIPDKRLAQELLQEMKIAKLLNTCPGFIKTDGIYVVQCPTPSERMCCSENDFPLYHPELLKAWDEFMITDAKEALNPRPKSRCNSLKDWQNANQYYCVVMMPHVGVPLEKYQFKHAQHIYQCLLQLTQSLAEAEQKYDFEHRDLHWGNVMIQEISSESKSSTLETTIIDFTFSRCNAGISKNVLFNGFTEDIFTGSGDSQFDVYREMRKLTNDNWVGFYPKTNVLVRCDIAAHHYTEKKRILEIP